MNRVLIIMFAGLLLSGCASVPEQIKIPENAVLVPFNQIINNPEAVSAIGEKARWGGRIVSVQNKQKVSEIEVIFFPEASNGKPKTGEESPGRFKAVVPGFVDPLVFEKDRLITIVGEVATSETGIIGEQNYTYPTLSAVGYFMWQQTSDVQVQNIGYDPFLFGMPFHNRGWSTWYNPWHSGFHSSRVRVIRNNGHSQGSRVERSRGSSSSSSNSNRQPSSAQRTTPSQPATQQR
ncbi:Slp family lipoprotein [Glaciecola sp. SC05]|uniref:Slp family lipoprotein n=1 Tax=Glaciecola sp. SC05 TaxID=1987355 RepID=UPI0035278347